MTEQKRSDLGARSQHEAGAYESARRSVVRLCLPSCEAIQKGSSANQASARRMRRAIRRFNQGAADVRPESGDCEWREAARNSATVSPCADAGVGRGAVVEGGAAWGMRVETQIIIGGPPQRRDA